MRDTIPMVDLPKLTPKKQRFVDAYLLDPNAKQAAIQSGSTAKRAEQAGHEFLKHPDVQQWLNYYRKKVSAKLEVSSERVLQEIMRMAFYDPADLMIEIDPSEYGEDEPPPSVMVEGRVIYGLRGPADIRRLPENVRRAIVGWGYDKNQNFTVKLADKGKALDQLARHLSLYNDKLEVNGVDALADRLARAAKANG